MVISLLLSAIVSIIAQLMSVLPNVGVADIPFIGGYIATYLGMAVSYINTGVIILPFLQVVWHSFVYVILPFEISLLVAKFFFGSRLPAHIN